MKYHTRIDRWDSMPPPPPRPSPRPSDWCRHHHHVVHHTPVVPIVFIDNRHSASVKNVLPPGNIGDTAAQREGEGDVSREVT